MTEPPFSTDLVVRIHALILATTGGAPGLRDRGLLESALASPFSTFAGKDLHPTVIEKAAHLAYAIVQNHPFVDGNKRTAAVLMITFLRFNGLDLSAPDPETEERFVGLADKKISRQVFSDWLNQHVTSFRPD